MYFSIHQIDWCCYHPESAQFFVNEQQRPTPFPLGRYPCCSQRAYRFEALSSQGGCRYKVGIKILYIFSNYKFKKKFTFILNIIINYIGSRNVYIQI